MDAYEFNSIARFSRQASRPIMYAIVPVAAAGELYHSSILFHASKPSKSQAYLGKWGAFRRSGRARAAAKM
jgi:hypothetical protein